MKLPAVPPRRDGVSSSGIKNLKFLSVAGSSDIKKYNIKDEKE